MDMKSDDEDVMDLPPSQDIHNALVSKEEQLVE
jgi:hypothetical protein